MPSDGDARGLDIAVSTFARSLDLREAVEIHANRGARPWRTMTGAIADESATSGGQIVTLANLPNAAADMCEEGMITASASRSTVAAMAMSRTWAMVVPDVLFLGSEVKRVAKLPTFT